MDELYNDIDMLIAKFLAGEASPDEAMMLHDWIEQSDSNRRLMQAAETAWALNNTSYQKPDVTKAFQALPLVKQTKQVFLTPWRIAASVLIVLCTGVSLYFFLRTERSTSPEKLWITKESTQRPYSWQLPENTSVTLNGNSSLRYPQTFENIRSVTLSGEAYFHVTPDPRKTFIISADAIEVKVLGTGFNVTAYPTDSVVSVQVVHGSVMMKHVTDSLVLKSGEKGLYHKITQKLWIERPENQNNIGYATHTFTYADKSLAQILDDLSNAYGVNFEVENPRVKECHLTGEYHSMTLPVILEVISKSLDLTYSINGNRVYISGDGCL